MPYIRFETCFDGEDALRGVVRLPEDLPQATVQDCLFSLELALRQFACKDLPEALRPRPLKLYPEPALVPIIPAPCAGSPRDPRPRLFDHVARVRQYLHTQPAEALRPALEGRLPRGLALTLFVDGTCRLHLTPRIPWPECAHPRADPHLDTYTDYDLMLAHQISTLFYLLQEFLLCAKSPLSSPQSCCPSPR